MTTLYTGVLNTTIRLYLLDVDNSYLGISVVIVYKPACHLFAEINSYSISNNTQSQNNDILAAGIIAMTGYESAVHVNTVNQCISGIGLAITACCRFIMQRSSITTN